MGKQETLETIWEVPDELWERIEPIILEKTRPKPGAASALTHDRCSTASSSAAQRVPMEPIAERAWDDSTIHRTFQRWVGTGVLHRMRGALVEGCEELDGVDWEWQAADGAMGKALFWGT